jgi:O-antigen ligase
MNEVGQLALKQKAGLPPEAGLALAFAFLSTYGTTTRITASVDVSAAVTLVFACAVALFTPRVLLTPMKSVGRIRIPELFAFWLFWELFSLSWGTIDKESIQEACVFITFVGIIAATSTLCGPGSTRFFLRALTVVGWGTVITIALILSVHGISQAKEIGANRGFAIEGSIMASASLVGHRMLKIGTARVLTVVLVVIIVVSLSRTAILATIVSLTIGFAMTSAKRPRMRNVVIGLAGGLVIFDVLASYFGPLRDRFSEGDNGHLLGFAINTEGRAQVWSLLLRSATSSWSHLLFGQGIGSAARFTLMTVGPNFPQPHNDYLRLVYDTGLIGFLLFVGGAILFLFSSYRAATKSSEEAFVAHLTAFLAVLIILIMMLTDNPLVYPFCLYPAACLIGLSLANRVRKAPSLLLHDIRST